MQRIRNRFILLLLLCCCFVTFFAQTNKKIDSLLSILNDSREDTNKVNILNDLCKEYYLINDFKIAIQSAKRSLSVAQKLNFKKGERRAFYSLGKCHTELFDFEEARKNYYEAIKIADEMKDKDVGNEYFAIALTFHRENNFPEALKFEFKALDVYEKAGDKNGMAKTYSYIGGAYWGFRNIPEADKYWTLTLKLYEETGDKQNLANALVDKSRADSKLRNDTLALDNCLSALKIYGELDDEYGIAYAKHHIALIFFGQGKKANSKKSQSIAIEKFKHAETYELSALSYFEKAQHNWGLVTGYIVLGEIYGKLHDYKKARYYQKKCNQLALASKNKFEARDSYLSLARLDSIEGKYRDAFRNYKLYISYRDSIINEESSKKMLGTKMQYEFDKKEDSLKQKQLVTEIKLHTQKKQKYFYLTGASLLALLSLFVFLTFRNQRKVNRLMNVAYAKEKALEIEKEAKLLAEFNRKFSESELKALRSQMNPHFVFNILNTIESYALENNKEGVSVMIQKFSRLTRLVLENSMNQLVPFQNDWRSLQLYVELEQMRYADDFLVVYNIQDEVLDGEYLIPPMIIQPFVENAIIHGLRNRADHYGILNLSVRLQNEYIIVEVQDNGIGRAKAASLKGNNPIKKNSLGIKLTQDRISIFNNLKQGKKVNVEIEDLVEGTKVTIAIPG
jgi:tetratricopeptide (TPR) repeat protein